MENLDKHTSPDGGFKKKGPFFDEGTDKKIHQHLSNENDVISEQDIENVNTSLTEKDAEMKTANDPSEGLKDSPNESSGDESAKKEKDSDDKRDDEPVPITTPWNILGS